MEKYLDTELKVWYDSDSELFFGEVKVHLNDDSFLQAVLAAGKNMKVMIEKLKRDYSNFVYGYNMAKAFVNLPNRLKYPSEDKIFMVLIK